MLPYMAEEILQMDEVKDLEIEIILEYLSGLKCGSHGVLYGEECRRSV